MMLKIEHLTLKMNFKREKKNIMNKRKANLEEQEKDEMPNNI